MEILLRNGANSNEKNVRNHKNEKWEEMERPREKVNNYKNEGLRDREFVCEGREKRNRFVELDTDILFLF